MSGWLAISVLLWAIPCFSAHASDGSSSQFVVLGNDLLEASYYYQLQFSQNHTTMLQLFNGDVVASRAELDAIIREVRQFAPKAQNYKDVTQFAGTLMNEADKIIGRLNCQFKSWTCEEDIAWVMKFAADAEVVDRSYKEPLNPRFVITKDDLISPTSYGFTMKVKNSVLLDSMTQYATVAAAKAAVMAIQAGKYSFQARTVPVGPVGHMTIWVLAANDKDEALAQETTEMMALDQPQVQKWIQLFAPDAKIEEPALHMFV